MEVSVLSMHELTPEQRRLWSGAQAKNPSLSSPFFRPEYFDVISGVREGVRVAVAERDSEIGFLPFQAGSRRAARPVGSPLTDFQGLISESSRQWNLAGLLRQCGLKSWRFDHLLASQIGPDQRGCSTVPSPYIDLTGGFENYLSSRPNRGSKSFANLKRAMRSAARDFGEVRLEFDVADRKVFERIVTWKRSQYALADSLDPFDFPWAAQAFEEFRTCRGDEFSGVVSALYFGERLAAAHFGIRTAQTLHYWFPAYDPDLSRYSPGMMCLLEVTRLAAASGIRRIDLGKGDESYKSRLMSGATPVAEGSIMTDALGRMMERAKSRLESVSELPVAGAPIRQMVRLYRRINRSRRFA